MADLVTPHDLAHELGLHESTIHSRLREHFDPEHEQWERWQLTRAQADEFLAWHANRYGTTG